MASSVALRLLLDTHILLWWLADEPPVTERLVEYVTSAEVIMVSAASVWEIGIKKAKGMLEAPDDIDKAIEFNGFRPLPISVPHSMLAAHLPNVHNDPFDRMLIAQAALEGLTLVTRDRALVEYGVPILAL
jgi:PIN domain nuclease of toxin-antitoxin system